MIPNNEMAPQMIAMLHAIPLTEVDKFAMTERPEKVAPDNKGNGSSANSSQQISVTSSWFNVASVTSFFPRFRTTPSDSVSFVFGYLRLAISILFRAGCRI
jgi:hypothetical protein